MNDFNPNKYTQSLADADANEPSKDLDNSTLVEFEFSDGKDRDSRDIQKVKDLEDLLGMKEMNPYGTLDKEIFAEKLQEMTSTDLQNLAIRVGIPPSRDRLALRDNLKKSFSSFIRQHGSNAFFPPQPAIDVNSPNYQSAVKLLRE
jgi:hypothetical protein